MEEDAGARRDDRRALRGRLRRGVPVPGGRRAVLERASRAIAWLRTRTAPRQDAPVAVRTVRRPAATGARRAGQPGDIPLPRLHSSVRPVEARAFPADAA